MKYDVLQDFKGSPDGYTVNQYTKGQTEIDLNDELAEVALTEKWVKPSKGSKGKAKTEAEAEVELKISALEETLAQLNAELAAAADAGGDTDPIVAQIESKQAELAELQQ